MNDTRYRKLELMLKAGTAALALIGAFLGSWRYFDTVEREFRKPYWDRQLEQYFLASNAVATIVTTADPEARAAAEATFWKLYFGPLALVEDDEVEAAMARFGDCLNRGCDDDEMKMLSLALAHACRVSIGRSWEVDLSELKGRYNQTLGN